MFFFSNRNYTTFQYFFYKENCFNLSNVKLKCFKDQFHKGTQYWILYHSISLVICLFINQRKCFSTFFLDCIDFKDIKTKTSKRLIMVITYCVDITWAVGNIITSSVVGDGSNSIYSYFLEDYYRKVTIC